MILNFRHCEGLVSTPGLSVVLYDCNVDPAPGVWEILGKVSKEKNRFFHCPKYVFMYF